MNDELRYPWQQTVVDAFLSLPQEVSEKVSIAQQTISARLKESYELEPSERIALDDAVRALRVLLSEANFAVAEYGEGGQRKIA